MKTLYLRKRNIPKHLKHLIGKPLTVLTKTGAFTIVSYGSAVYFIKNTNLRTAKGKEK